MARAAFAPDEEGEKVTATGSEANSYDVQATSVPKGEVVFMRRFLLAVIFVLCQLAETPKAIFAVSSRWEEKDFAAWPVFSSDGVRQKTASC